MKKLLFAAIISVSIISSAFAAPANNVNARVISAFRSQFSKDVDVQWSVTADYARASFVLNNTAMEAFYTFNGDFIGVSHAITIDDLPTSVKRSFAKKYGSYTVKEAVQFNGAEESAYYVSAQNDLEAVILKIENDQITVFEKKSK